MKRKDKTQNPEITFGMQIRNVFFSHVKTVVAIFLIGIFLLSSLFTINVVNTILGAFLLLMYGLCLYASGYTCAIYDLKSYTKTTPFPLKGILLSLSIPASNLFMWLLMKYLWTFNPGETITEISTLIGNVLFVMWTFPYNTFMNFNLSHMSIAGHILIYIFPVITVSIGYFAGYKKWDISSKFSFLVYEKKKK